ncbi:hypothetical protein POM88_053834 [Heracleum sosnowskyi]|uniref:Uncharacterized protein n=1 Tax=Heracleum sosnowskyi TaxID=360622 RepID=A0AAD8GNX6_9APIA|nr:hypothetical protein POM88_053834 [Heracleum sosnowskyi]
MDESTNSSQNQTKKRTCGPTVCKKLKEQTANKDVEKTIELNEYGRPKPGKWKSQFTTYIGVIGRQRVDINTESWKVVNQGLKNTIWQDIKGEWNIKDDEHKKRIMKRVGKLWKDFKSRMVDKLFEGEDPCEKYDYIKKEQWEKFRKAKETPEFKEIRSLEG